MIELLILLKTRPIRYILLTNTHKGVLTREKIVVILFISSIDSDSIIYIEHGTAFCQYWHDHSRFHRPWPVCRVYFSYGRPDWQKTDKALIEKTGSPVRTACFKIAKAIACFNSNRQKASTRLLRFRIAVNRFKRLCNNFVNVADDHA